MIASGLKTDIITGNAGDINYYTDSGIVREWPEDLFKKYAPNILCQC